MRHAAIEPKHLRSFGLTVGGIFAAIGLWPAVIRDEDVRLWAVALAGLLLLPALVRPRSLQTVYRVWMRLGEGLGWINARIILGVIFLRVVYTCRTHHASAGEGPDAPSLGTRGRYVSSGPATASQLSYDPSVLRKRSSHG
jgi:hypothetical protein